jgi:chemotaxis protein CheZ
MAENGDGFDIREELSDLHATIQFVRIEVAQVRHPDARDDRLGSAALELDAIINATESATQAILAAAEEVSMAVVALRAGDEDASRHLDAIDGGVTTIFTECSFQDVTGQRVAKVIDVLEFIEARIERLIEKLGVSALPMAPALEGAPPPPPPRLASQSDIDALFG